MNSPRLQKLKGLIGQYQLTNSPIVFEQIMKRIDRFIVYNVRRFKQAKYLRPVREEDLYQTAILGAYEAIKIFPNNGRPEDISDYLKSYMRRKVNSTYGYLKREFSIYNVEIVDGCINNDKFLLDPIITLFRKFEVDDILSVVSKLIISKELTLFEVEILHERLILDETYKVIARKHNCSIGKIYTNYRIVLNKLRVECEHLA